MIGDAHPGASTHAARAARDAFHRLLGALPLLAAVLALASLDLPAEDRAPGLAWQVYSAATLRSAARAGRPVIVDVSAAWCTPCVEMERRTFRNASVVALASGFTLLRVDVTSGEGAARTALTRLGVTSIPTILVFDRNGRETRRLVGFTSHAVLARTLERVETEDRGVRRSR